MVLANAACALLVSGLASSLREGVSIAAQVIDSGKATATLEAYAALSRTLRSEAS